MEDINQAVAEAIGKNTATSLGLVQSAWDKNVKVQLKEYGNAVLWHYIMLNCIPHGPITKQEFDRRAKSIADYREGERLFNEMRPKWEALGYYYETECGASCCD